MCVRCSVSVRHVLLLACVVHIKHVLLPGQTRMLLVYWHPRSFVLSYIETSYSEV